MKTPSSLHSELNNNYRRKIAKRDRRQPPWSACVCHGLTIRGKLLYEDERLDDVQIRLMRLPAGVVNLVHGEIGLHECFRPGGPSCKRRATRGGWRHSPMPAMGIPEEED